MYLVVNVKNLKAFEPSMLDYKLIEMLCLIDDLVIDQKKTLDKDAIIEKILLLQDEKLK